VDKKSRGHLCGIGHWVPAFAGMTVVNVETRRDTQ
jgi:hypothetical protein